MDNVFGVGIKITWSPGDIDKQVGEIQKYLDKKPLDLKINLSQNVLKSLEKISQQTRSLTNEATAFKGKWSETLTDLSKLSNVKTTIVDGQAVERVATIHKELGEVLTITQRLDQATGKWLESTKQVDRVSEDQITKLRQQLQVAQQSFSNKALNLESNYAGHFESNALEDLKKQAAELKINDQLPLQINLLNKQFEELGIKARASFNQMMHGSDDLTTWLSNQQRDFESGILKFTQQKSGLFDQNKLTDLREQFASLTPTTENLRDRVATLKSEFKRLDAEAIAKGFNTANKSAISFGESISTAAYKMGVWVGVGGVLFGLLQQFKDAFSFVKETNMQLTTLQMEMTNTQLNFTSLTKQANDFAISMGNQTDQVIKAISIFGNYNSTMDETLERSKAAILLSNLTGEGMENSANAILAMQQQFGYAADQSEHLVDVLAGTARMLQIDYPVAIKEVSEGIERVGSVAQQSGLSLERLSAMVGTTAEVTRMSGDVIGNAYKTIFSRITNVGDESNPEEFIKIEKSFHDIGVSIKDSADSIRPMGDILDDLASRWGSLTDVQQNQIALDAAGVRQKNIFLATMQHYNEVLKNTEMATNSAGVAQQKQDIYMQSLQAHINQFVASVQKLYISLANSDTLKSFVDMGTAGINVFAKLADTMGTLPVLIGTATFAIAAFNTKFREGLANSFVMSPITNYIAKVQEAVATSRQLGEVKVNPITAGFNILQTSISGYVLKLKEAYIAQQQLGNSKWASILNVAIGGLRSSMTALVASEVAARVATAALQATVTMGLSVAITFLVGKISELIDRLIHAKQRQQEFFNDTVNSVKNLTQETTQAENLISTFEQLSAKTNQTAEEKQKLIDVQKQLATMFPQATTGYTAEGEAIANNTTLLREYLKAKQDELNTKKNDLANQFKSQGNSSLDSLAKDKATRDDLTNQINTGDYDLGVWNWADRLIAKMRGLKVVDQDVVAERDKLNKAIGDTNSTLTQQVGGWEDVYHSADKFGQTVNSSIIDGLIKMKQEGKNVDIFSTFENLHNSSFLTDLQQANQQLQAMAKNGASADDMSKQYTVSASKLWADLVNVGVDGEKANDIVSKVFSNPAIKQGANNVKEATFSIENWIKENKKAADEIEAYNNLLAQYNNGHKISGKELSDLLEKYPQLIDALKVQGDTLQIDADALTKLRDATVNTANSTIDAEINRTKATIAAVQQRVQAYQDELNSLKVLANAYSANAEINEAMAEHFQSKGATQRAYAVDSAQIGSLTAYLNKLNALKSSIGASNFGVKNSSTSSSSSKSQYEDPTDAIIRQINLQAELTKAKNETIQSQIEEAKSLNDYNTQVAKTTELMKGQSKQIDELWKANESLTKKFNWYGHSEWLDQEGEATKAYYDLFNSASESAQKNIESQFNVLQKLKKAMIENRQEIYNLTDAINQEKLEIANNVVDVVKKAYEEEKKVALDSLEAQSKALDEQLSKKEKIINAMEKQIDLEQQSEDYNKKLTTAQKEQQEIQNKINALSPDNSIENRARLNDLRQQLQDKKDEIADMQIQHSRDLRKQNLQDQLQAAKDETDAKKADLEKQKVDTQYFYDELINDESKFAQIRQDILSGNITNLKSQLTDFLTFFTKINQDSAKSIGESYQSVLGLIGQINGSIQGVDGVASSKVSIPAFDSGGYTGDWGSGGGKLAILHSKEIILNKADTSNLLKAIDLTRNLVSNFKLPDFGSLKFPTPSVAGAGNIEINFNVAELKATPSEAKSFATTIRNELAKKGIR